MRAVALSGRRGSNPRLRAWEARALPTELLPRFSDAKLAKVMEIRKKIRKFAL